MTGLAELDAPSLEQVGSPSPELATWRTAVHAGARDVTPMAVGVVPLSVTIGVLLSTSGLSSVQAVASGPIMLAGASQLAALRLLAAGVAPTVVIASSLILNVRIVLYGAAFAPWFARERLFVRLLLAIPIVDQLYFVCIRRFERGDLDRRARLGYYAGAAGWLYGTWWATQLVALAVGPRLLDVAGALAVLAPLALVALLAIATSDRPTGVAATAAAALAIVAGPLPCNTSLLVAALGGIALGSACRGPDAERAT
jgi:predicted branched-subunit amino acid permease